MLGQTTKWLRLLGVDAEYAPTDIDDDELMKISSEEGRILVTRDKELAQTENAYLAPKKDAVEVVKLLLEEFEIELNPMTRCTLCNSPVERVLKEDVLEDIPEGVREQQDEFWRCVSCEHIYWRGSHWDNILETLQELMPEDKLPKA